MKKLVKTSQAMSLLEIVLAITLFSIAVPCLSGIFFSNENLSDHLSTLEDVRNTAKDVKNFVKLANYDKIFSFARNHDLLTIQEMEEEDILSRKFVKCLNGEHCKHCKYLVKLELADVESNSELENDIDETCSLPLRCRVFHLKHHKIPDASISGDDLAKICDIEYSMFLVKNR